VAFAIPAVICRGLLPIVYGCQLVGVSLTQYFRQVLVPTHLVWIVSFLGLRFLVGWDDPDTWPQLIGYAALYGAFYLGLVCFFLIGPDRLRAFVTSRREGKEA